MSAVDVSVVIPVGSVTPALDRQVQAVLDQDCAGTVEVVLALNTTEIDPGALAARITGRPDRPVHVVDARDRRGAAHARNSGAAAAAGSVLAFCDADDLVHPGWLAALVGALADHDAASGYVIDVFPDERTARWHPPATPGELPTFLGARYVLTGNLAVRRAAFEAVGGFDETLTRCEDIALGWALTAAGFTLAYAPDAVIDYHRRAGLRGMLRTHYLYGRGMSDVLARYAVPEGAQGGGDAPRRGLALLRPNGQSGARGSFGSTARRGAIALGRVHGLLLHRARDRSAAGSRPDVEAVR